MSYILLYEMFFRQLCKISSRFANPTSSRRQKDVFLPTEYHTFMSAFKSMIISIYSKSYLAFENFFFNNAALIKFPLVKVFKCHGPALIS